MDMTLEEIKESGALLSALIDVISQSKVSPTFAYAVLAKLVVLYGLQDGSKEEFLHRMSFVYDFEQMMKPQSDEVH